MTEPAVRDLARRLAALEAFVGKRGAQLAYTALEDGAIREFDLEGTQVAQYGQQFDGTSTAAVLVSPIPPTPSAPLVNGIEGGLRVAWDGTYADSPTTVSPMDWHHVDVVVGPVGMDPIATPPMHSITSGRGGDAFLSLEAGAYEVALVTRTQAGKASPPSVKVAGTALAYIDTEQFEDLQTDLTDARARLAAAEQDVIDALAASLAAQNAADAASTVYKQSSAPTVGMATNDLWIDSDDGLLYVWTGSWTLSADQRVATLVTTTATKTTAFFQISAPSTTGRTVGDMWVDTDDGNKVYDWSGSWTPRLLGASAIGATAMDLGGAPSITTSGTTRTFYNVLTSVPVSGNLSASEMLVINTPITMTNKMFSIHVKGLNYIAGRTDIDFTANSYATTTPAFGASGFNNTGSSPISVRLARNIATNTVALILTSNEAGIKWSNTKISIPEAIIGHTSGVLDSWLTGWTVTQLVDETAVAAGYDTIVTPTGYDAGSLATIAKAAADSKITVYRQSTAPTGGVYKINGDLWIDSDDGLLYYTSTTTGTWLASPDQRIAAVVTSNAAKTTVFAQISAPSTSGRTVGDIWIDTDDGNTIYDWPTAGGWTARKLGAPAISATARELGAVTIYRQSSAPASGMITNDLFVDSDDGLLYVYAGGWQLSADQRVASLVTSTAGKVTLFSQTSAPPTTGRTPGDLWIDTDDGNRAYVWELTPTPAWVDRRDATIAGAASLASQAKNAADAKVTVFYQASSPAVGPAGTYKANGDLWIDSDDGMVYITTSTTGTWVAAPDQRIGAVVTSNAAKTTVFAQISQPSTTGRTIGDIWIDIDDGNKIYDWSGSWTVRLIGAPAVGFVATDIGGAPRIVTSGTTHKTFYNVLAASPVNAANATGLIVITTPITFTSKMFTMRIKGYNYSTLGTTDLDLTATGYAHTTNTVVNSGVSNNGSMPVSLRFGRSATGTLAIILKSENPSNYWQYTKLTISEVQISQTTVPDSWLTGWSAALLADEAAITAAYTDVISPVVYDPMAAAVLAKGIADSKVTVYRQSTAPTGGVYKVNGDLWIDSDDGMVYYASTTAGAWLASPDQRIAQVLSQVDVNDGINPNPNFTDWPVGNTMPTSWILWTNAPTRETTLVRGVGGISARFNCTDATTLRGMYQAVSFGLPINLDYITVTMDVMLNSGTSFGGSGVMIDWNGLSPARTTYNISADIPAPVTGKWYRITKVLAKPAGATGTQTGYSAYVMGQYGSGMGTMSVKDLVISKVAFAPSTVEEIAAYNSASAGTVSALTNTVNSKTTVFAQISQPATTGRTIGDIWIDTDDGNKVYDWSGSWTVRLFGSTAISATARQLGAVIVTRQSSAPASGMLAGDLWLDTDDGLLYTYTTTPTTGWQLHADQRVAAVVASDAVKTTLFSQTSAPSTSSRTIGDMWIDTDDGNKIYDWALPGPAWTARVLGNSALGDMDVNKLVVVGGASMNTLVAQKIAAESGQYLLLKATNLEAHSVTIDRLNVGSTYNLVPNGMGEYGEKGGLFPSTSPLIFDTTDKPTAALGAFRTVAGQSTYVTAASGIGDWDCSPGEEFWVEIWVKANVANSVMYVELRDQNNAHGTTSRAAPGQLFGGGTSYPMQSLVVPTTWTKYVAISTATPTAQKLRIGSIYFNHSSGSVTNAVQSVAIQVRRRSGGELIVDGTVRAQHLAAASVSVDKLTSGSIQAGVDVIAGNVATNYAKMTSTGFKVFVEDPVDLVSNEVVRMGSDTGDLFAITDAGGAIKASISETGQGSFTGLSVDPTVVDADGNAVEGLTIYGKDFLAWMDELPRGVVAWENFGTDKGPSGAGTEYGYGEIGFVAVPGRLYKVSFRGAIDNTVAAGITVRLRMTNAIVGTAAASPTLTSPQLLQHNVVSTSAAGFDYMFSDFATLYNGTVDERNVRILATFNATSTATATMRAYGDGTSQLTNPNPEPGCVIVVEDIGKVKGQGGAYNAGGAVITPVQTYVSTWNATNSETYDGSGNPEATDVDMKQGYSSYDGDSHSVVIFGGTAISGEKTKTIATALSGATIKKVEAYLYFNHWYYNSGGTALIRSYNSTSLSSTTPTGTIKSSASWPKPGGRWVDITSIATTAIRGITIGKSGGTNLLYYGRANGHTMANKPQLRITYTR